MRQVQVRGCLPAVLTLVLLGGLVALVVFASLAVALPVAGALLVLGLARSLWYRLTGRTPPSAFRVATIRTVRIDPGWTGAGPPGTSGDEGPVVDALPRAPRTDRSGDGEAGGAEPGRLPGSTGPGGAGGPSR
jgi:hypothetical protein